MAADTVKDALCCANAGKLADIELLNINTSDAAIEAIVRSRLLFIN